MWLGPNTDFSRWFGVFCRRAALESREGSVADLAESVWGWKVGVVVLCLSIR